MLPFLFWATWWLLVPSQPEPPASCGAQTTPEQAAFMRSHGAAIRAFDVVKTRGMKDLPVQIHIVQTANGSGGIRVKTVLDDLERANQAFAEANIRLVALEKVNYIKSNSFYQLHYRNSDGLWQNDVPNVINLYYVSSITLSSGAACGYAYLPTKYGTIDRIVMSNSCSGPSQNTLTHELGHFFGLMHTHGPSNNTRTKEYVDGSNCQSTGDQICDTPADPQAWYPFLKNCTYQGTLKDKRGRRYKPDATNFMSYAPASCRGGFSKGQLARINYCALNFYKKLRFPANTKITKSIKNNTVTTISHQNKKLSGSLQLEIDGQKMPIRRFGNLYKATRPYYSGTNYQMFISNFQAAYVYVFSSDQTRKNTLLYPTQGQQAFFEDKETHFPLPSAQQMFQLDQTRGKDYVCVLYARQPLPIKAILQRMERQTGHFTQRLFKVLGARVVSSNRIQYQSRNIKFSGNAYGKRDVIPIILEFDHL